MWDINGQENHLVLNADGDDVDDKNDETVFGAKVQEVCDAQIANNEYLPVKVDEYTLSTMNSDEVYWCDYRQYHPQMKILYYKASNQDVDLVTCPKCCRFFRAVRFFFLKIRMNLTSIMLNMVAVHFVNRRIYRFN